MTHAQTRGGQDMRLILCMVEEPEYLMMIVLIFLFDHDTITTQHITHTVRHNFATTIIFNFCFGF